MYQVLARKYRPQSFSGLIGQEHVRTTLENAIARRRIAHGYIFSGQRGTGKTTAARILGRSLNCVNGPTAEPCGACSSCLEIAAGNSVDVIEIDAASNRGINEMRELRESVRYRPARDRYKIFIIDEAHQITSEAFNALLKTLEEPPEWVVFVLCTTEAHKIPTTIASRCQQFSFRSLDFGDVVAHLRWICAQEGVEAGDEVLAVLAQSGEGSVRDSLSALDQAIACCGDNLPAAEVRHLLGLFSLETLHQVTDALSSGGTRRMLEIVGELERDGRNLQHFCRELARYFRNLLVARIAGVGSRLIAASDREQQGLAEIAGMFSEEDLTRYLQLTIDLFRDMQFAPQPRLHLEIGLLRMVHAGRLLPIEEALASLSGPTGGGQPPPAKAPMKGAASPPSNLRAMPQKAPAPQTDSPAGTSGWKARLHEALVQEGKTFIADAVEHAVVTENAGELEFVAAREFSLALQSGDLLQVVQRLAGRPVKVVVKVGEPGESPDSGSPRQAGQEEDEHAARRAFAHPEVERFRQMFPGSQVRAVRNLRN